MYVVKRTSAGHSGLQLLPSYIWSLEVADSVMLNILTIQVSISISTGISAGHKYANIRNSDGEVEVDISKTSAKITETIKAADFD